MDQLPKTGKPVDKVLQLLELCKQRTHDPSLYNGLMGTCIAYFVLSKITSDKKYDKRAHQVLSDIQGLIPNVNDLGFADGLSGIGWGVEWLVQNGFIQANSDKVLEELDDTIYTSVVYAKTSSLSIANGSIGKAMYFLSRLTARNPSRSRYRMVCILECLVLLSDEISDRILALVNHAELDKSLILTSNELIEIAHCLTLMLLLNNKKINTVTSWNSVKVLIEFIENYIITSCIDNKNNNKSNIACLNLVYSYLLAKEILKKDGFTNKSHIVNRYVENNKFSRKLILNIMIAELKSLNKVNSDEYRFLFLLDNLNSIDNTQYCFESYFLHVISD